MMNIITATKISTNYSDYDFRASQRQRKSLLLLMLDNALKSTEREFNFF